MQGIRKLVSGFILLFPFSLLYAQKDSVIYLPDSLSDPVTDATVRFFQQHEKAASPAAISMVTKKNKIVKLPAFLDSTGIFADHVLADLDKDGKKELLISNYTGGSHCCDEIYIFKNIAPNRYQHAVKLFAGNTIITKNSEFVYDLYEQFGYFFTCYACAYIDTTDEAPVQLHSIIMKYNKGKMVVVPGDKELRSTIMDNLGKLGELPYEKLDEDVAQDNGQRKEFAINLAVFHFSFGKNILETQKLFNKYYKYPDAKKIWTAFVKQLQYMKKDNDF